jgi:hypothetical protein
LCALKNPSNGGINLPLHKKSEAVRGNWMERRFGRPDRARAAESGERRRCRRNRKRLAWRSRGGARRRFVHRSSHDWRRILSIEIGFHSPEASLDLLVSDGMHDRVPIETAGRLALVNPDATFFFEGKLGTFAKLQAISNWFGEDDTTGFVNSEGHAIVNGRKLP